MRLHLFRHGQTNWNAERRVQGQSESRLTELGVQQAAELGRRIRHLRFDALYCSSSVRARQTAAQAFAHLDQEITYLDTFREISMGPWEGRLYDEVSAEQPDSFHHFWQQPHLFDVQGAETFAELQQRALTALAELADRHGQQEVALVSHGALIKSVLCHAEGKALCDLWTPPHMHNCAHSIIEFSEVTDIRIEVYADTHYESTGSAD